jgi:signal transduction histidine kinase
MPPPIDILLVDDEPRNLDALESILTDPGYRLLRSQDADHALRLLLDHDVAAIVLDIKMPGVSGFELAQMIKNTRRFRETPIVFLTAYLVDDRDVLAGYGAGAVDYLTKPVNPQVLRHKVAVFAELFRKTRELADLNSRLEDRVKERTAELERSEAALRAAAQQKDDFLATLAHELRNPLAPLRTGLDLLVLRQPEPVHPGTARTLGAMNRQLDHMVRLIDDLLDISRIGRGLLELKRERVDLAALVESTVAAARSFFKPETQTLSLDLGAEPIDADADPTRVAQILTNLLHNAAKFTSTNGRVAVDLRRVGTAAIIRVSDSGAGIPPDQLERVFDMFTRIVRPGVTVESGLGIGLALARRLTELHGGTLTASSAGEGKGTTFTLSIPAIPAAVALAEEASAANANANANRSSRRGSAPPMTIVVIEDNDDAANTLVEWLQELGHRVEVARSGPRGVELVQATAPKVVLCDLGLPGMDGLAVCRSIRALPGQAQPMMVAMTGWGRNDDRMRTKDAGFDHHLVKPVEPAKLAALLHAASEQAASGASRMSWSTR